MGLSNLSSFFDAVQLFSSHRRTNFQSTQWTFSTPKALSRYSSKFSWFHPRSSDLSVACNSATFDSLTPRHKIVNSVLKTKGVFLALETCK